MRRFFVVITCAAALAFGSVALADNQMVADNIEQALVQSAALEEADQIQVSVKDGVVTLDGVAASSQQRSRIESVVRRVPGVNSVNNRMNVGDIQQVSASILEPAPYSSAVGQQAGVSILSDVPLSEAQPTPAVAPEQGAPVQYGTPLPMTSTDSSTPFVMIARTCPTMPGRLTPRIRTTLRFVTRNSTAPTLGRTSDRFIRIRKFRSDGVKLPSSGTTAPGEWITTTVPSTEQPRASSARSRNTKIQMDLVC